jgi:hypothetical protein
MLWMRLRIYILESFRRIPKPRPKISLIIPFSSKNKVRKNTLKWLLEYWKSSLPEAQIVLGHSRGKVFCKGEALNDAMKRARGKVIVIMDADAYIEGKFITYCADRILDSAPHHLWYVPYRHLYRLTREVSSMILASSPYAPLRMPCPPPPEFVESNGHKSRYGHRYGAMCMIFPREAYDTLGCFDERFRGWGGEDVALLRALDTLYGKHKTTKNAIFHLWHPFIGENYKTRMWDGQKEENPNNELAMKYHRATGKPLKMRKLVDKGCKKKE